jgi:hypothetical protein
MNYLTAEQRDINRNIHNRPKGWGTKPLPDVILADLSASGGFKKVYTLKGV